MAQVRGQKESNVKPEKLHFECRATRRPVGLISCEGDDFQKLRKTLHPEVAAIQVAGLPGRVVIRVLSDNGMEKTAG